MGGVVYFYLGCYYLDFDEKVFSEVSTALRIKKFRRIKSISSLRVFPLLYH